MKKIVRFFLFGLCIAATSFFANFRTDGFTVSKILSDLPADPRWDLPVQQIDPSLLKQKFYYLASGRQCFVFQSADKKYVLKFLNHNRFLRKPERIEAFFSSFHIGFQNLKEETGMVFLQLNRTNQFTKKITLVDKIGYEHHLDLNQVEFILQKKANMIYPTLQSLSPEKYKKALDSFLDLLCNRIRKGVVDDDLNVPINIGFLEDKAILIDFGRLFLDPTLHEPARFSQELRKSSKYLIRYLDREYPAMGAYFQEQLQLRIKKLE